MHPTWEASEVPSFSVPSGTKVTGLPHSGHGHRWESGKDTDAHAPVLLHLRLDQQPWFRDAIHFFNTRCMPVPLLFPSPILSTLHYSAVNSVGVSWPPNWHPSFSSLGMPQFVCLEKPPMASSRGLLPFLSDSVLRRQGLP